MQLIIIGANEPYIVLKTTPKAETIRADCSEGE